MARIVEAGTGKKPIIYTSAGLWDSWFPRGGLENLKLWAASWGSSHPTMPNNWNTWQVWQNTDHARVPGISGAVDGDVVRSLDWLNKLAS